MGETIDDRLRQLGITLPTPAAPAANYVPFVIEGGLLHISGQLPVTADGVSLKGRLGDGVTVDAAKDAAKLCAINILAQAKAALSDLARIRRLVRITAFVASTPDFTEQHLVANGASDFLADALGPRGRHARVAVGVAALPLGAAVEIDALIAVD
jgi:enamine deaminase RidA (YjgF/YER057c/UK114 family)